jgi:hypothetical protein
MGRRIRDLLRLRSRNLGSCRNAEKALKGRGGKMLIKQGVTLALLIAMGFVSQGAAAQSNKSHRKSSLSKHTSRSLSSEDRHPSSADYSVLRSATVQRKSMDADLKKLESQSTRMGPVSRKAEKTSTLAYRPPKTSTASDRATSMNFRSKPAKNKMNSNSKSKSNSKSSRGPSNLRSMKMR